MKIISLFEISKILLDLKSQQLFKMTEIEIENTTINCPGSHEPLGCLDGRGYIHGREILITKGLNTIFSYTV